MNPINWRTYDGEGELVERLLAALLHNRFPAGRRRRPASGDGGIDFHVEDPVRGHIVYQIKSFTASLGSSRKSQVRRSLERVSLLPPDEWHLVVPMDPTSVQEQWFDGLVDPHSFPCHWSGQTFCDTLAADFPEVVDYFLGDGANRFREAIEDLGRIQSGLLPSQPSDVFEPVEAIVRNLNRLSPFWKFDIETHPTIPLEDRAGHFQTKLNSGVVMYKTLVVDESTSITLKVRPKYEQAVEDDPISLSISAVWDAVVSAEGAAGTGEPFQFTASVSSTTPGGSHEAVESTVVFSPMATEAATEAVVEMEAQSPEGNRIAAFSLPNCTVYGGMVADEHVWSSSNGAYRAALKAIDGQVRVNISFRAEDYTAFAVRAQSRTLLAATESGCRLVLKCNGEVAYDISSNEEMSQTEQDHRLWFEALVLLADLTPILDTDYSVPDTRIGNPELDELRDAVRFAAGELVKTSTDVVGTFCLREHVWESLSTDGLLVPSNATVSAEIIEFERQYVREPIVFHDAHIHLLDYRFAGDPEKQCDSPDYVGLSVGPGDRGRAFFHRGPAHLCQWRGPLDDGIELRANDPQSDL